uniref:Uncharacterized protein n=1 Tax=Arundo donax TaxID=35708 RepID=A0A0A9S4S8_ARUDO
MTSVKSLVHEQSQMQQIVSSDSHAFFRFSGSPSLFHLIFQIIDTMIILIHVQRNNLDLKLQTESFNL